MYIFFLYVVHNKTIFKLVRDIIAIKKFVSTTFSLPLNSVPNFSAIIRRRSHDNSDTNVFVD